MKILHSVCMHPAYHRGATGCSLNTGGGPPQVGELEDSQERFGLGIVRYSDGSSVSG